MVNHRKGAALVKVGIEHTAHIAHRHEPGGTQGTIGKDRGACDWRDRVIAEGRDLVVVGGGNSKEPLQLRMDRFEGA